MPLYFHTDLFYIYSIYKNPERMNVHHLLIVVTICAYILTSSDACRVIDVTSASIGSHRFHQIPIDNDNINRINSIGSGRPVYFSEITETNKNEIYLYHISSRENGRWVINDRLGSDDSALAYIDSWAVTPYLTYALSETNKPWRTVHKDTQEWVDVEDVVIQCSRDEVYDEVDHTIYFDASRLSASKLSGLV